MTRDVQTIDVNTCVTDALARHFGAQQAHRAFPIVRNGELMGVVDRSTLGAALKETPHARVGDLCGAKRPEFALPDETCRAVAARLAAHSLDRVPVVADEKTYMLVGIVSRHDLVKPSLSIFNEERQREQFRSMSLGRDKPLAPVSGRTPSQ
jgi:CBS domain-containing protein